MKKITNNSHGFGAVAILVIVLVLAIVGLAGWTVYSRSHNDTKKQTVTNNQKTPTKTTTKTQATDPYAGWKTATSSRAGFSIKYPTDWTYSEAVGTRDNVEHITIDSSHMHITIDSYVGSDIGSGGKPGTTCPDCTQTSISNDFIATGLGKVNLNVVRYTLDDGSGNALTLTLPDSTYYIPSSTKPDKFTSFRAISVLNSEQAYQAETPTQFANNPDFKAAQNVLESIAY